MIKKALNTTIHVLQKNKVEGIKTVLVTAYDYPFARMAEGAGIDIVLIGDSMAMTILGYESTTQVTIDEMLPLTKACGLAIERAMLIGDMPFMSYQPSDRDAIINAGRFIREGTCDAVKVEGIMFERIKAIVSTGIMVMGHIGLTPQTKARLGGYRVQGKTAKEAQILLDQALRQQDAGCSFLLLEAMPREVAGRIAKELTIPVYGVGAGDLVDGQLVIMHDLIGMFDQFKSKFIRRYCEAGRLIENALKQYASDVRKGKFPALEHFYQMEKGELEALSADANRKHNVHGVKTENN